MPAAREELDDRYPELVRLAYLILPAGRSRRYRLALARRIAEEGLPRGRVGDADRAYGKARVRVLSMTLRQGRLRRARLRAGIGRWLAEPATGFPEGAGTERLRELAPAVRAAYVMRKVEGQRRYAVRDQLAAAGVREPLAAVEAADLIPPPAAIDAAVLPVSVPPVQRGPRLRSRVPVAAATVLTAVLVGGIAVTEDGSTGNGAGRAGPVADVAYGALGWPARGDLVHDTAFVRAATAAWRTPHGRAGLLFAGRAGTARVALLTDGRRVARYVAAPAAGGAVNGRAYGALGEFPAPPAGTPLVVAPGRYLLAPGTASVRVTGLGRVPGAAVVRDGLTDPIPVGGGACWSGPILVLPGGRLAADLGGPALPAWSAELGPGTEPAALGCAITRGAAEERSVSLTRLWSGRLPGGGDASWLCARYGGGPGTATLVTGHDHYLTGSCERPPAALRYRTFDRSRPGPGS